MSAAVLEERRQFERRKLNRSRSLQAKTFVFDPSTYNLMTCIMLNVSISGALMETEQTELLPERFQLLMDLEDYSLDCRVVWRLGNKVGVEFV